MRRLCLFNTVLSEHCQWCCWWRELCYLDLHRGHADAVQLSSVCADGQSLLCRTDAHGINLLAFSRGQLIAVWVWRDLTEKNYTCDHFSTYTEPAVQLLPVKSIYPYLPASSITVLLVLFKKTDCPRPQRTCKALSVGQNGCDARHIGTLIHVSIFDLLHVHFPVK